VQRKSALTLDQLGCMIILPLAKARALLECMYPECRPLAAKTRRLSNTTKAFKARSQLTGSIPLSITSRERL